MNAFKAIDYEQELAAAGVAKEQAAVHAKALGQVLSEVAFCSDLRQLEANLRKEIGLSEQRLSERLDAVRLELNTKIDIVKTEPNAKIDNFRTQLEARLTSIEFEMVVHRWLFGVVIAFQIGTRAAVMRLSGA